MRLPHEQVCLPGCSSPSPLPLREWLLLHSSIRLQLLIAPFITPSDFLFMLLFLLLRGRTDKARRGPRLRPLLLV